MEVKTVAFTGHRPQSFESNRQIVWVQDQLLQAILRAARVGCGRFISGGALGVDQWAAESVIASRGVQGYRLTIARPFPSQDAVWNEEQKRWYRMLLEHADEVVDINPDPYAAWKLLARNKWMMEQTDAVIAVWNGQQKGGTHHAVLHAQALGKPIFWINPVERKTKWLRIPQN